MAIIVSKRIPVKRAYEDIFERRWKNRKWAFANYPGFIKTEVVKPVKGDRYVVVTHWQSMKDVENWTNSDAFMESHAKASPVMLSRDRATWEFTK